MKLKMYLRGLGIGIIVTAVIMGLSAAARPDISDAEIIKRAEALGMTASETVLKPVSRTGNEDTDASDDAQEDMQEPAQAEPTPVITEETEDKKEAQEPKKEEKSSVIVEESEEDSEKQQEEAEQSIEEPKASREENVEDAKEEPQKEITPSSSYTLEVAGGYGSETVSALLEKGGVIASASDFDQYLCDHGYDHKIVVGKHVIPAGADYETIAKIITHK